MFLLTIKYIFLAIVQFIGDIISYPLAPIVVLFAKPDGYLPSWLSVFQTYDNSLDGDDGYKTEHRPFPQETNKFQRWVNRFCWLWRNPAYGLDMVLGADCQVGDLLVITGDRDTGDGPYHPGICKWYLYRGTKLIAFQWYYVGDFSLTKCLRINAGWKLWNAEELTNGPINTVGRYTMNKPVTCQLVFTPGLNLKR